MTQTLTIIGFIVIFAIIGGLYLKKKNMSFDGEVIDKDIKETDNINNTVNNMDRPGTISFGNKNNVSHFYSIKVRTTAGKDIHWNISEGKYEIIKIGDFVTKRSGTTDIEIIQKIADTNEQSPVARSG